MDSAPSTSEAPGADPVPPDAPGTPPSGAVTSLRARARARQSPGSGARRSYAEATAAAPIPPFAFLCDALGIAEERMTERSIEVSAPFLRFLIGELVRAAPFDPTWYAQYYPDIEPAVAAGEIASAHEHYLVQGYFEKRLPHSLLVDPDWYWRRYSDLAQHYRRDEVAGLCEHLFSQGWWEGRVGTPELGAPADVWVEAARRFGGGTEGVWHLAGRRGASPDQAVLRGFESLGWNCEFGLVQKFFGLEPLSLLAFGSLPPERLIEALICGFDGLGEPDNTSLELIEHEWFTIDRAHGYSNHTWRFEGQAEGSELLRRECRRLQFLKGKLLRDLAAGRKILVYKKHPDWPESAVPELFEVLRTHGDNVLLWADLADERHDPGEVQLLSDGFYKGYLDRFSPIDAAGSDISYDCWLRVCANLSRMLGRNPEGGGEPPGAPALE